MGWINEVLFTSVIHDVGRKIVAKLVDGGS